MTYIIAFVISVLLNLATSFLLMYAFDEPKIWKNEEDRSRLWEPKISHLLSSDKLKTLDHVGRELKISHYVEHVICPSYYYFVLRDETFPEKYGGSWITCLTFQFPTLFSAFFCLSESGLIGTDIICAIIVIASCSAGSFVLYKIYNKTLKIRDFNKTIDELFDLFERDKGCYDFDVPEKYAFNEFAINAHLSYLLSIKDTVRTRQVLKRYINFISLLLYALIFLPINFE